MKFRKHLFLAIAILLFLTVTPALGAQVDDGHCVSGATAGSTTWYFAEGCTRPGFNTYLCLANQNPEPASVHVTYFLGNGTKVEKDYSVPAQSRATVHVHEYGEVGCRNNSSGDVSMMVTSNKPIVAERPMYFAGTYLGGHDVMGATALATDWYFAEGFTGQGFDEWISVLNPGADAANVTFQFQTKDGLASKPGYQVLPNSRGTFKINDVLGSGIENSLHLVSSQAVIAERAMYFSYAGFGNWGWQGGHCVMGATSLANTYYFAEGYTGDGFEEWLTLQNPGSSPITVDASYQLGAGEGTVPLKHYPVAANGRSTIFVPQEAGFGKNVSVKLSSSSTFLAERPIYFLYQYLGASFSGGHCVIGATAAATDWSFAEGYTGTGFHEWLTLQNPGDSPAQVIVTYMPQGGAAFGTPHQIPAKSRYTVFVNTDAGNDQQISCLVHSDQPLVAERPIYFMYDVTWAEYAQVMQVINGHTIQVRMADGSTEQVRYIGIDCPIAGQPFAAEATSRNSQLVSGQVVRLDRDVSDRNASNQLLRYVFAGSVFVNGDLVAQGWAVAAPVAPDLLYADYFAQLQAGAQANGWGMWQPVTPPPPPVSTTVYITNTGTNYHRDGCSSLSKSKIPISLEDAKAQGYTPCSLCKPPV